MIRSPPAAADKYPGAYAAGPDQRSPFRPGLLGGSCRRNLIRWAWFTSLSGFAYLYKKVVLADLQQAYNG